MQIILPHKNISKKVESWGEIKGAVKGIKELMKKKDFVGKWKDAFSIHHSQVSEDPYNFFIPHANLVKEKSFRSDVIINPVILEASKKDLQYCREACMSYAQEKTKKLKRYCKIRVRYQIKRWYGFQTVEEEVEKLVAQIFQHEIDHSKGIYIYDNRGSKKN